MAAAAAAPARVYVLLDSETVSFGATKAFETHKARPLSVGFSVLDVPCNNLEMVLNPGAPYSALDATSVAWLRDSGTYAVYGPAYRSGRVTLFTDAWTVLVPWLRHIVDTSGVAQLVFVSYNGVSWDERIWDHAMKAAGVVWPEDLAPRIAWLDVMPLIVRRVRALQATEGGRDILPNAKLDTIIHMLEEAGLTYPTGMAHTALADCHRLRAALAWALQVPPTRHTDIAFDAAVGGTIAQYLNTIRVRESPAKLRDLLWDALVDIELSAADRAAINTLELRRGVVTTRALVEHLAEHGPAGVPVQLVKRVMPDVASPVPSRALPSATPGDHRPSRPAAPEPPCGDDDEEAHVSVGGGGTPPRRALPPPRAGHPVTILANPNAAFAQRYAAMWWVEGPGAVRALPDFPAGYDAEMGRFVDAALRVELTTKSDRTSGGEPVAGKIPGVGPARLRVVVAAAGCGKPLLIDLLRIALDTGDLRAVTAPVPISSVLQRLKTRMTGTGYWAVLGEWLCARFPGWFKAGV